MDHLEVNGHRSGQNPRLGFEGKPRPPAIGVARRELEEVAGTDHLAGMGIRADLAGDKEGIEPVFRQRGGLRSVNGALQHR